MKTSIFLPILTILFGIIFLMPHCLLAQSDITEVIYLEKDNGLHERKINHALRDSKGFFYFVSDNSVQRFDGKNFENVNLLDLVMSKLNLRDLQKVIVYPNKLTLRFPDKIDFSIDPGSLHARLDRDVEPFQCDLSRTDNKDFEPIDLEITIKGKTYRWSKDGVSVQVGSTYLKIINIPFSGIPKFLRTDSKGNIIAAYSKRFQYVDHYFILDNEGGFHDFSHLASAYDTAIDVYTDDAFYKWMVCGHNGVKIITLKRLGVDFIMHDPTLLKGQFGQVITGIASKNNELYLTNESGRLSKYSPKSRLLNQEPQANTFISGSLSKMMYDETRDDLVLLGRDNSLTDLYFLNTENGIKVHHQINGSYRDYHIDKKGNFVLAGQSEGKGQLAYYEPKFKKTTLIDADFPPLRCIHYDSLSSQYFIGTYNGMYVCDENFKIVDKYDKGSPVSKSLLKDDIVDICRFDRYVVLCSNGGGIYILDPLKKKVVKNINGINGLTDNIAISAIVDDNERCWIGTFNGLNVIDTSLNVIKKIYEFDGLPDREFNTMSATKVNGDLYFGTINGAVRIIPQKVMNWKASHRISLEKVRVFKKGNINDVLIDSMSVRIPECDSITIAYSISDYYKYPYYTPKVDISAEGFQLDASFTGEGINLLGPNIGLTNLDISLEGQADFNSIALNVYADYTQIKRFLYSIFAILFLSTIIIYFTTLYIRAREKKKTVHNKKISELQLSALQGQMNPHFIFNALGAIQYFIQTNDVNRADEYLADFALLMRAILDSSSRKFITLKEELKLLKLYVGLEKARFENKFKVNFRICDDLDDEMLIPPMIIQPYIENAVNHGLHHLKTGDGVLDIFIDQDEDLLVITIEDNGVGRQAVNALKNEGAHQSRGMGITAQRVRSINVSSDIHITIDIKDLKSKSGIPLGTKVVISIRD